MGQQPLVVHLDTSVLIFMLERRYNLKDYQKDLFNQAKKLRRNLSRMNCTVKISIVALGELTNIALKNDRIYLIENLRQLGREFGEKLKTCYSPRLCSKCNIEFHNVVARLLQSDKRLIYNPADALILAFAVYDEEATRFYTTDSSILISKGIRNEIEQIRKDYGYPELIISGLHAR